MNNLPNLLLSKHVLFRVLFVFYVIFITILSLLAGAEENSALDLDSYGVMFLDKILHLLAYAIFAIQGCLQLKDLKHLRGLCIAIALYGILLEFIQHAFIPDRMGSIDDAVANIAGVIIGYRFCQYLLERAIKMGYQCK
ncbi:hypothetical protein RJ45_07970 [Photobacterium gaetbulicola]|uniref:VanZ-like domain-containing protein n=1 Tax=Photobacterium gaetbulicola TaxID=1295392 RepID=A0A0B9H5R1_9GAMM|nr:VanZ family protein [Photobacterium gaetbulicola]KHT64197.1 hypothetical protein RJ45_07970 [Photobacterium gaetbulicola]